MRRIVMAGLMALTLCTSARAADSNEWPAAEPFLGGLVHDEDVKLVFDYLREALSAAVGGREVQPPEALVRRAETIGDEVKRRGVAMARALLDVIELSVRESVQEPRRLPPSSPLQRTRH